MLVANIKIEKPLKYQRRLGLLGHVTSIMSSDFHFLVSENFHTKFGSDWHSCFWENPV